MMGSRGKREIGQSSIRELSIKESGALSSIRRMGKEFKFGLMGRSMRAIGKTIWLMDREGSYMEMGMCMRGHG